MSSKKPVLPQKRNSNQSSTAALPIWKKSVSSSVSTSPSPVKVWSCACPSHDDILCEIVEGLYAQQIRPLFYEVRRRLQKNEDCCPQLLKHFQTLCESSETLFLEESPDGLVVLLRTVPADFKGFIDPRDTNCPYPLYFFPILVQYLLERVAKHGLSSAEFAGGRFMLAQHLQEEGPAVFRALSVGQLCHLIQLSVSVNLLGYENCCLKLIIACSAVCHADWKRMILMSQSSTIRTVDDTVAPVARPSASTQRDSEILASSSSGEEDEEDAHVEQTIAPVAPINVAPRGSVDEQSPQSPVVSEAAVEELEEFKKKFGDYVRTFGEKGICMSQVRQSYTFAHAGEPIPFVKFGFTKLINFLQECLSDVCVVENQGKFRCAVKAREFATAPSFESVAAEESAFAKEKSKKQIESVTSSQKDSKTCPQGVSQGVSQLLTVTSGPSFDVDMKAKVLALVAQNFAKKGQSALTLPLDSWRSFELASFEGSRKSSTSAYPSFDVIENPILRHHLTLVDPLSGKLNLQIIDWTLKSANSSWNDNFPFAALIENDVRAIRVAHASHVENLRLHKRLLEQPSISLPSALLPPPRTSSLLTAAAHQRLNPSATPFSPTTSPQSRSAQSPAFAPASPPPSSPASHPLSIPPHTNNLLSTSFHTPFHNKAMHHHGSLLTESTCPSSIIASPLSPLQQPHISDASSRHAHADLTFHSEFPSSALPPLAIPQLSHQIVSPTHAVVTQHHALLSSGVSGPIWSYIRPGDGVSPVANHNYLPPLAPPHLQPSCFNQSGLPSFPQYSPEQSAFVSNGSYHQIGQTSHHQNSDRMMTW